MGSRTDFVYLSLARHADGGDDRAYLEWHQLEHLPEKYQFAGITGGQRWVSTSACRAARAVEADDWATVAHVTTYLMAEPIEETLDDFYGVWRPKTGPGSEVKGNWPVVPIQYQAPLKVLESYAASRINLPPQVVPFRPNQGVYLVAEEASAGEGWDDYLEHAHGEVVRDLLTVPGVAGAWVLVFASDVRERDTYHTPGRYCMTIYYLDDDPAAVGKRLAEPLQRAWAAHPMTKALLGAPFESLIRLDLARFGPGSDEP